jgi:hypothetical protein
MAIPTDTARTTEVDIVRTALGLDALIDDENNGRRIDQTRLRLKAQIDAYCVMPSATPKPAIQANRREAKSDHQAEALLQTASLLRAESILSSRFSVLRFRMRWYDPSSFRPLCLQPSWHNKVCQVCPCTPNLNQDSRVIPRRITEWP